MKYLKSSIPDPSKTHTKNGWSWSHDLWPGIPGLWSRSRDCDPWSHIPGYDPEITAPVKIFCDHGVITNHARDHRCDHSFHHDHGYEKAWWEWSHLWSRLRSYYQKCYVLELSTSVRRTKLLWEPKPSEKATKLYELSISFHLRRRFQFILSTDRPKPLIRTTT